MENVIKKLIEMILYAPIPSSNNELTKSECTNIVREHRYKEARTLSN